MISEGSCDTENLPHCYNRNNLGWTKSNCICIVSQNYCSYCFLLLCKCSLGEHERLLSNSL